MVFVKVARVSICGDLYFRSTSTWNEIKFQTSYCGDFDAEIAVDDCQLHTFCKSIAIDSIENEQFFLFFVRWALVAR